MLWVLFVAQPASADTDLTIEILSPTPGSVLRTGTWVPVVVHTMPDTVCTLWAGSNYRVADHVADADGRVAWTLKSDYTPYRMKVSLTASCKLNSDKAEKTWSVFFE